MSLDSKKVVQIGHNFINKRDLHHHLLVPLHLETLVSIMVRTSDLDQQSHKVVWHKEVVRFLYVISVVETIQVNVIRAKQFASSVVNRVTF